jgi:SAM-dependent methyltransferase
VRYYPPRFLFRRYELLKRIDSGSRFLEVGPGSLNLTHDLARHFASGVLVDYNPETAQVFDKLEPGTKSKLSLVICDFQEYQSDQLFNVIVACEVLEHIEQDVSFLKKAYGMLENGGQIVLSVPARRKYWSVHDEVVGHLRRYERNTLRSMLAEAGFSSIEIVSYGYPFLSILRIPRILLAKLQASHAKQVSISDRTKESAFSQYRIMWKGFGLLCNRITTTPFSMIASMFNDKDLSNGYIAIARKTLSSESQSR